MASSDAAFRLRGVWLLRSREGFAFSSHGVSGLSLYPSEARAQIKAHPSPLLHS